MDQPTFQIARTTLARRCEICHQSDCFDPVQEVCSRCSGTAEEAVIHLQDQAGVAPRILWQELVSIRPTNAVNGFICGVKFAVWCIFWIVPTFLVLVSHKPTECFFGLRDYQPPAVKGSTAFLSFVFIGLIFVVSGGLAGLFWGWIFSIWERYDNEWKMIYGRETQPITQKSQKEHS